ncbi:MAG TPA: hypothetical protein VIX81_04160 [Gammaproteobacteria bacterium]
MQDDDKTAWGEQPTNTAATRTQQPIDLRDLAEDLSEDPKALREKARDLLLGLL